MAPPGPRNRTRTSIGLAAVVVLVVACQPAVDEGAWFKPGAVYTHAFADPSLTPFGPMLTAYATNTGGTDLPAAWSADATTWTARVEYEGDAANGDGDIGYFNDAFPDVPWGVVTEGCDASTPGCDPKELWAPSVGMVGGRWMGYHAVQVAPDGTYSPYGRFCIFVSTASGPLGPFTAARTAPLVCPSTTTDPAGAIDPDVFVDDNGRAFLLWKTEGNTRGNLPALWSAPLDGTGTSLAGPATKLLSATGSGWEGNVIENPSMVRYAGRWWLLYSGNEYASTRYAVGYAVCSGPAGPCTRGAGNPILRTTADRHGPGGADAVVDERGRLLAAYHAWTGAAGTAGAGHRRMLVAELSAEGPTLKVRREVALGGVEPDELWSFRTDLTHTTASDQAAVGVGGTFTPTTGDFDGDGRGEVFWYGPWDRLDAIWEGTASPGSFAKRNLPAGGQRGSFLPVPGDFNGDGLGDVFWYQPGGDPIVSLTCCNHEPFAENDELWFGRADGTFIQSPRTQAGQLVPVPGDFDGNGVDDILWFAPGTAPDELWLFDVNGLPAVSPVVVDGTARPVPGDFDGDGDTDLFWYGPGIAPDEIWTTGPGATFSKAAAKVGGDLRPFAGDFDGDSADEVFWYGPGPLADTIWSTVGLDGSFSFVEARVDQRATPLVGDFDGNGTDDVFWHR